MEILEEGAAPHPPMVLTESELDQEVAAAGTGSGIASAKVLLEAGREALILTDAAAKVTFWNEAASVLYGVKAEEAIGVPVVELLGGFGARIVTVWPGASSEGKEWSRDCWVRRPDGELICVDARCTPTFAADGSFAGVVVVGADSTGRKQAAAVVRQLSAIAGSASEAIISTDNRGRILSWNAGAEQLYGYTEEEAVGASAEMLYPPGAKQDMVTRLITVGQGTPVERVTAIRRHKDGRDLHVRVSVIPLFDDEGEVVGVYSLTTDLTEHMKALEEREAAVSRFEAAFRHSKFGMIIADLDAYPRSVSPAVCAMLGRDASELIGRRWQEFSHPDDVVHHESVLNHINSGDDIFSAEWRYIRPDGSVIWVHLTSTLVRNSAGEALYFMTQLQDITDRKDVEEQLRHQALHDELTGLPNRVLLTDRLEHALAASVRNNAMVAVAFLDLDRFKHVNDALGHAVGDQLLIEVGRRLSATVRAADTVCRFGGDEFVVIYENTSPAAVALSAQRLIKALADPIELGETTLRVQASVGISISRSGSTGQSMLSEADAAMYRAKHRGPGRVEMFDESLRSWAAGQLEGERALRQALVEGRIVAYYQPIVDIRTNAALGVEALARWTGPEGSSVPPSEFIAIAERCGLIGDLGRRILTQSVTQVAAWNSALSGEPLWASVNISARQLSDSHLTEMVASALERSGLPPHLLHLEITESALMEDVPTALEVLHDLKALGVGLTIDDFGTGYSSLAYLRQLPVDTIKIDRAFVEALDSDPNDTFIVQAVLALSSTLGLQVVAEGVETDHQCATLDRLGCELGQGFRWSPAVAASTLDTWSTPYLVLPSA